MAIVTMTTTIENNPVRLPLPEQADITVVNASTGATVYTLHVTDAGTLVIDDADASDTAVFDNTVAHAAVSNSDVPDADPSVTAEAASDAAGITASKAETETDAETTTTDTTTRQFTGVADADRICVTITYDTDREVLVGDADGRVITTANLADLMRLAQRYNAPAAMTFDIPHRGMTTFDGYLETNYRGMNGTLYDGVILLGAQGGAQVFNDNDTLADDMRVVREIDIRFAAEDVRSDDSIVVATPDDDADDSDNDGDDDDTDAEDDADITAAAQKMYATTWARSHVNADSWVDIAHYAAQHDLAVKAGIFDYDTATVQGVYTGRLVAEHDDVYTFVLADDVHGRAPIDMFPGTRAGFTWLTVFSDTAIDTADTEIVGDSAYMQTTPGTLIEHFRERFGALDTAGLAIDNNDADAGADSTAANAAGSTVSSTRKIYATLRADDPDNVRVWRTIGAYARRHGLSVQARIRSAFAGEDDDVYVGKLYGGKVNSVHTIIDKSKGECDVDLVAGATIDATTRGFTTLAVFSGAKKRRQGFRGTNERDYEEVSVAQLRNYLHEHFGDYSN